MCVWLPTFQSENQQSLLKTNKGSKKKKSLLMAYVHQDSMRREGAALVKGGWGGEGGSRDFTARKTENIAFTIISASVQDSYGSSVAYEVKVSGS